MFTGLVETTGTVTNFRRAGSVFVLSISAPDIAPELVLGQSVAVSGTCLSVTRISGTVFDVDMMYETAQRTWFGERMRPGIRVNLERAMRLGDRLDGHMVLGHVDGTAVLRELSANAETRVAVFTASAEILRGIVPKGSVAIDGVSLTIIDVTDTSFCVGLIPTTLRSCTIGGLSPGDSVNIETDILGKYVERLLTAGEPLNRGGDSRMKKTHSAGVSMEELIRLGY